MGIMTSPALADIGHGIAFRPSPVDSLVDTGINTNEELDASETAITMDADASSAIAAGNVIHIEAEDMLVTSVVTVTVNVERGYANSDAATHTTNQDVFRTDTANTVLWLPGQDDAFSSTIRDRSGKKNNGAITGATWVRTAKGLRYVSYDGVDDITTVTASVSIANIFDGGATAKVWVNLASDGEADNGHIFYKRSGDTGWQFFVQGEVDNKLVLRLIQRFDVTNGDWVTTATEIDINTWTMLAVTYDVDTIANNPIFYIASGGSVKVLTVGSGITEAGGGPAGTRGSDIIVDLSIGNNSSTSNTTDGGLALELLETRILSAVEIESLYRQERGLFGV